MCLTEVPLIVYSTSEAHKLYDFGRGPIWSECLIALARGKDVTWVEQQVERYELILVGWKNMQQYCTNDSIPNGIAHCKRVIAGYKQVATEKGSLLYQQAPAAKVYDF